MTSTLKFFLLHANYTRAKSKLCYSLLTEMNESCFKNMLCITAIGFDYFSTLGEIQACNFGQG